MIHYHGLPMTPTMAAYKSLRGKHAFVSYAHQQHLDLALAVCQSVALDNGAFSAWKAGKTPDWDEYLRWAFEHCRHPRVDWCVIPDVIEGTERENDELIEWWEANWGLMWAQAVPVWHMHESIQRLERLAFNNARICIGSSAEYATVGTKDWWQRMNTAMRALAVYPDGRLNTKVHGLRMLNPRIFTKLPLASADSCNVAMNIGIDSAWKGTYQPATKELRAAVMIDRIESHQGADKWVGQIELI